MNKSKIFVKIQKLDSKGDLPSRIKRDSLGTGYLKQCSHCKKWLYIEAYYKKTSSKDGLAYNCKVCDRMLAAESYERSKKIGGKKK